MAETTLSALIAGLAGLFGAIIGGCIASINTWTQIKHQKEDAQIARFVKAREIYLLPLREALSKYMSNIIKGYTAFTVYNEEKEREADPKTLSSALGMYLKTLDVGAKLMEQIEALSWQSSDTRLLEMISDLKDKQFEIGNDVVNKAKELTKRAQYRPGELKNFVSEFNIVISNQSNRLIPINKRIEELLCGME